MTKNNEEGSKIDHPSYYQGPHECIELMEYLFGLDAVKAFCRCNSFKYRFRAGNKEGNSEGDDMEKALWYEDYLIDLEKRDERKVEIGGFGG